MKKIFKTILFILPIFILISCGQDNLCESSDALRWTDVEMCDCIKKVVNKNSVSLSEYMNFKDEGDLEKYRSLGIGEKKFYKIQNEVCEICYKHKRHCTM